MTATSDSIVYRRSQNLKHLKPSATITVTQEAQRLKAAGRDIVDLSAGEPDFGTPKLIADAGVRAIQEGKTHYPPNSGTLALRAAAARNLSLLSNGRPVNADNIVVSTGAKQSVFNTCFSLFGPGDRVLIPSPAWVSYPQMVHLARATPEFVPGELEWGLKVGVAELDRAADANTLGLILCSPNNPTGSVYTLTELKAIAEWAKGRGIWIIADEIYRRIHYAPGPAPSFLDLSDELLDRVVIITGASKSYAMTGWRIGLALAPPDLAKAMAALQTHVTSGASHPSQCAAAEAFGNERIEADLSRMVDQFRSRRDLIVGYFREHLPGLEFVDPLGAFYFFFRVDSFFAREIDSAIAFSERLLADEGVALVPGEAFGDARWVRLSFAASESDIQRALERLVRFIATLKPAGATS